MAPVTAMAPVCGATPAPFHASRIMWTPSYGIASACNPLAGRTCGYGVTACFAPMTAMQPVSACAPYVAAAPVATTTFRPFLYRLFHPFTPLVPTTTYRAAFCAPACGTCATAMYVPTAMYAPAAMCAPACSPCAGMAPSCVGGSCGAPASACPSADCAPVLTDTPTAAPSLPAPSMAAPSMAAPSLGAPLPVETNGAVPQTYREEPQPATQPDVRLRPVPEQTDKGNNGSNTGAPRLIDPVAQRAAHPIRQATFVVPVSRPTPSKVPVERPIDFGGWRASSD